ncbi:cytochrome oxidase assembly protein ShyY1 [Streptacidiphilus sp. MAP12-20]|uniref:SURF1 family protein n=1 Tax=Streptacidiphilus sp. MAP12-20 TaxID=3156299 RepID=UPI003513EBE6
MYRFLLTPRWLGIHLLAVVAVPVCVILGLWQLSRYELHSQPQKAHVSADAAPSALAPLIASGDRNGVGTDAGRRVSLSGTYDAAHQFVVPQRALRGQTGSLILTPMKLDGTGEYVAVVRGWLPGTPTTAPAPPTGTVSVTARMQAAETADSTGVISAGGLPTGQLGMVSSVTLVNLLPYSVWNGSVALDSGASGTSGLTPLPPPSPASTGGGGISLQAIQNLGYVAQWFVFAGFVIFMWFRFFRREVEQARDRELGLEP